MHAIKSISYMYFLHSPIGNNSDKIKCTVTGTSIIQGCVNHLHPGRVAVADSTQRSCIGM